MDTRQSSPVGGAAFRDAFGGAFSWCKVCKKHLAMATCGAGWCAQCYASAAQGGTMLTLAVHDAAGCKFRGRGAQPGSLLSPPGAASSATTPPGAHAQALGAAGDALREACNFYAVHDAMVAVWHQAAALGVEFYLQDTENLGLEVTRHPPHAPSDALAHAHAAQMVEYMVRDLEYCAALAACGE